MFRLCHAQQALEGMWQGDCHPGMVSLFAKEMLEQVVLRGQGGYGKDRRRPQRVLRAKLSSGRLRG